MEAAAGEVGGAIDVAGGEGIGFFGFGGKGAAGALDAGETEGDAVLPGGGGLADGFAGLGAGEVVEGPVGEGFVLEDGAAVGRVAIGEGASGFGAYCFEARAAGVRAWRLGGLRVVRGSAWPGRVVACAWRSGAGSVVGVCTSDIVGYGAL